ncbi:hypothetical protein HK096_005403 [Nowakowskiella sp. JEL0078]|nr:hypothetical protein HK096_005403 [Nowakowskiella sp. JEL0078]
MNLKILRDLIFLVAFGSLSLGEIVNINVGTVSDLETQISAVSGYSPESTITINLQAGQYQLTNAINITDFPSSLILIGALNNDGSIATTLLAPSNKLRCHIWIQTTGSYRPNHELSNLILSGCTNTITAPITVIDTSVTIDTVNFVSNKGTGSAIELYKSASAIIRKVTIRNGSFRKMSTSLMQPTSAPNTGVGIYASGTATFQIKNLTIIYETQTPQSLNGGAITLDTETTSISTIDGCLFQGLSLSSIYAVSGSLQISNCFFKNIVTDAGAGFYFDPSVVDGDYIPKVNVSDSSFENLMGRNNGGVISLQGSGAFSCVRCSFTKCSAWRGGIAQLDDDSTINLFDSVVDDGGSDKPVGLISKGLGGIISFEGNTHVNVDGLQLKGLSCSGSYFETYSLLGDAFFNRIQAQDLVAEGWGSVFMIGANVDSTSGFHVNDSQFVNITSGMGSFSTAQAGNFYLNNSEVSFINPSWGGSGALYSGPSSRYYDIVGSFGGALNLDGGIHYFRNVSFVHLAGGNSTAAISIDGSAFVTIEDSKFTSNGFSRPLIDGEMPHPHPWAIYDNVGGEVVNVNSSTLIGKNLRFVGNVVGNGGSISVQGSSVVKLENVKFRSNTASSNPVLTTALDWTGRLNITNALIKDNISKQYGQIFINPTSDPTKGHITLKNINFENNRAVAGGALYVDWNMDVDPWDCIDCSFIGNQAIIGGAIYSVVKDCFHPESLKSIWTPSATFYKNSARYFNNIALKRKGPKKIGKTVFCQ